MVTVFIIFLIWAIAAWINVYASKETNDFSNMFIVLVAVFFTAMAVISLTEISHIIDKSKQYKVDLPEEISLAKYGDTLYVNKITNDSIYLGFRK